MIKLILKLTEKSTAKNLLRIIIPRRKIAIGDNEENSISSINRNALKWERQQKTLPNKPVTRPSARAIDISKDDNDQPFLVANIAAQSIGMKHYTTKNIDRVCQAVLLARREDGSCIGIYTSNSEYPSYASKRWKIIEDCLQGRMEFKTAAYLLIHDKKCLEEKRDKIYNAIHAVVKVQILKKEELDEYLEIAKGSGNYLLLLEKRTAEKLENQEDKLFLEELRARSIEIICKFDKVIDSNEENIHFNLVLYWKAVSDFEEYHEKLLKIKYPTQKHKELIRFHRAIYKQIEGDYTFIPIFLSFFHSDENFIKQVLKNNQPLLSEMLALREAVKKGRIVPCSHLEEEIKKGNEIEFREYERNVHAEIKLSREFFILGDNKFEHIFACKQFSLGISKYQCSACLVTTKVLRKEFAITIPHSHGKAYRWNLGISKKFIDGSLCSWASKSLSDIDRLLESNLVENSDNYYFHSEHATFEGINKIGLTNDSFLAILRQNS